jgi:hypothetical protein
MLGTQKKPRPRRPPRRRYLNDEGVARLRPRQKRDTHADPELIGHYVRVLPTGVKSFLTVARDPFGKQVWTTIGRCDHINRGQPREGARDHQTSEGREACVRAGAAEAGHIGRRRGGLVGSLRRPQSAADAITPKDARKVDKIQLTQVGRALSQLGITHIPSYSPQGRGQMERVFGTLQKRLPQELHLARIKTVAAANRYLRERFVPDYNARFAVPAAEPGSAFVPYTGRPLTDVLCVQEDRVVGADNCVSFNRRSLQIPPQGHRRHYVRATVRVHQYPDGSLAIFDGPRCIAPVSTQTDNLDMPSRKPPESARRPRGLWVCGQRKSALPTSPTGPNNRKQRTFDVLQNPDIFTR